MPDFCFFSSLINSLSKLSAYYAGKHGDIIINLIQSPAAGSHNFWLELATIITPLATILAALIALGAAIYTSNKSYTCRLKITEKTYKNSRKLENSKKIANIKNEIYEKVIMSIMFIHDAPTLKPNDIKEIHKNMGK